MRLFHRDEGPGEPPKDLPGASTPAAPNQPRELNPKFADAPTVTISELSGAVSQALTKAVFDNESYARKLYKGAAPDSEDDPIVSRAVVSRMTVSLKGVSVGQRRQNDGSISEPQFVIDADALKGVAPEQLSTITFDLNVEQG